MSDLSSLNTLVGGPIFFVADTTSEIPDTFVINLGQLVFVKETGGLYKGNGNTVWSSLLSDISIYAGINGLNSAGTAPQFTSPLQGVRTPALATTQYVTDSMPDSAYAPWMVTPAAGLFAASASSVWYTANAATGMRFSVDRTRTFRYANLYVGTQSGNIQIAVSRLRTGNLTNDAERVVETGVITCPASGTNRIDLGFFTLTPGEYLLSLWCDNTTAAFLHGLATGITGSRLTFSATGMASGVPSGVTSGWGVTTRWVSGLTLEAAYLPTSLLGDSITANDDGTPASAGSWFSLMDQSTGYRFYPQTNNGVASENSTQILARAAAAFSGKRYAVILAGTNDIGQNVMATTIISNLQTIYAAAVSAGLIGFAACTIPPRVGTGGLGTSLTSVQISTLKTVNAWIRANYNAYAGGTLVDWTWALSDGTDESSPLLANLTDGVHPNATGKLIMALILRRAIRNWT